MMVHQIDYVTRSHRGNGCAIGMDYKLYSGSPWYNAHDRGLSHGVVSGWGVLYFHVARVALKDAIKQFDSEYDASRIYERQHGARWRFKVIDSFGCQLD
jgi:hypothetical protein